MNQPRKIFTWRKLAIGAGIGIGLIAAYLYATRGVGPHLGSTTSSSSGSDAPTEAFPKAKPKREPSFPVCSLKHPETMCSRKEANRSIDPDWVKKLYPSVRPRELEYYAGLWCDLNYLKAFIWSWNNGYFGRDRLDHQKTVQEDFKKKLVDRAKEGHATAMESVETLWREGWFDRGEINIDEIREEYGDKLIDKAAQYADVEDIARIRTLWAKNRILNHTEDEKQAIRNWLGQALADWVRTYSSSMSHMQLIEEMWATGEIHWDEKDKQSLSDRYYSSFLDRARTGDKGAYDYIAQATRAKKMNLTEQDLQSLQNQYYEGLVSSVKKGCGDIEELARLWKENKVSHTQKEKDEIIQGYVDTVRPSIMSSALNLGSRRHAIPTCKKLDEHNANPALHPDLPFTVGQIRYLRSACDFA